jgi:hypothetical protein
MNIFLCASLIVFCPASKQVVIPAPRGMPDTRPEGGARPATCEFTCSAHAARGIPVQAHRPLHRDATTWGPGTRSQDTATGASPTWPPASADGYPRARTLVPATHSRAPLRVTPSGASRRRVPQARTHPTRSDLAGGDCARVSPTRTCRGKCWHDAARTCRGKCRADG